ncbi:MAG: glycosyltransferase [Armatimonadetes bacterium]|nr:glycosyltransferase [Armatimonadota bacterium]
MRQHWSTMETYGNIVSEALATGLPVVAAATGGLKKPVVDGCNGFACRPRNAADLAAVLL